MYLFIYDDHVELRDARHFWGQGVSDTEDGLRRELGIPELRVASIGPAGENLVRFACIMNDKHRAAGRSGVGAVMGSKNLKAIAVRGTGSVQIAKPEAFMKAMWDMRATMQDNPGRMAFAELGTAATIDMTQAFGGLPTRNFQQGQFEEYENLNGNTIKDTRLVANKACFACTIACGRVTRWASTRTSIWSTCIRAIGDRPVKVRNTKTPGRWAPTRESAIWTRC